MQKKHLFLLLLILGTGFWGISFTFVKVGIGSGSPYIFLFYKFLIAFVVLSTVFFNHLKKISKKTVKIGFLIGIPLLVGNFLQSIGLRYTTVSNSAFITGMDVLLIPILKFAVYKKKVANKIWLACVLALIGLYIIVVKDGLSLNYGDLWIVACAFAFAFYVLQVGKYSKEADPIPSVIILMLFCAIGSGMFGVFDSQSVWIPKNFDFWNGVLFAGLFATAFMYTVQNIGQRYLSEEKVAMTYLFEPIFATIAGIIILGETFNKEIFIGGSLIFCAMLIVELNLNFKRKKL